MFAAGKFALALLATFAFEAHSTAASHSFAGSNLYYAAGLYPQDTTTLLQCGAGSACIH